jgi:very-short-patch-repair endonuclease
VREDANPLGRLLLRQQGVVTRAQAVSELSASNVRHRVASGRWQALPHGVLVTHSGPITWAQQCWAVLLCCGDGALLGGASAAIAGGMRWTAGPSLDVLVPASRRPHQQEAFPLLRARLPGVTVHRTTHLPEGDIMPPVGLPRTTMARSIVDAAQWAPTDDLARALVAAACQQRRLLPQELATVVARMPRARRRRVVLEAVDYASGGAQSLAEINFLRLCRRHGLPRPSGQVRRPDAAGRNRYLDAYWKRWRLHVEIDGGLHLDPAQWWADMARQNGIWVRGDRILRFPAWAVRHREDEVAAQVRAALDAAGWRPKHRSSADLG